MDHMNPVKAISFDGGGMLGYHSVLKLEQIEQHFGQRAFELFDIIAGTSTGGIIAACAGLGIPATEIRRFYLDEGPKIFEDRLGGALFGLRPRFDIQRLFEAASKTVGKAKFGQMKTRVIIPSTRIPSISSKVWKSYEDPEVLCADVCCTTSAAPTFFGPHLVDDHRFIDGGLWANRPAAILAAECLNLFPGRELRLLDIATPDEPVHLEDGSFWAIAPVLPKLFMRPGADGAAYVAKAIVRSTGGRMESIIPAKESIRLDIADVSRHNFERMEIEAGRTRVEDLAKVKEVFA
jgi:hypothetical protein